jgi:hypothetical protein
MEEQESNSLVSAYPVSIWEVILILLGAIALVGAAGAGLGIRLWSNANDPQRAEAIARSLIDYQIPGGSEGVFGVNIGSAKFAWVRSKTQPPDVILFIGRTPITKETDKGESSEEEAPSFSHTSPQAPPQTPPEDLDQGFSVTSSRIEDKVFCGKTIPTTIEEGQQVFDDPDSPVPAVRYTVSTTESDIEQTVILTTNGSNAAAKASRVFKGLRCK